MIDQNDWTPINDPRIFDKIDLRTDYAQDRIVFVGSENQNPNTNKNPSSQSINRVFPRLSNNRKLSESKTLVLPFIRSENLSKENSVVVSNFYTLNPPKSENISKIRVQSEIPKNKVDQFKTFSLAKSATSISDPENSQSFEGHVKLQKKLETNLANVLKAFEGNLSRILETAAGNASAKTRELSSRLYETTNADKKETGILCLFIL